LSQVEYSFKLNSTFYHVRYGVNILPSIHSGPVHPSLQTQSPSTLEQLPAQLVGHG